MSSSLLVRLPRGALSQVRNVDPQFAHLMRRMGPFSLKVGQTGGPLGLLIRSIVHQQLSAKAAATIFERFCSLFGPSSFPSAEDILAIPSERLRACGLSYAKVFSVQELCRYVASGALQLEDLSADDDQNVVQAVTRIRGLGPWSAQMLLIFGFGRLDIWPTQDAGIAHAIARLHGVSKRPDRADIQRFGEAFRPFRTVASWYLWRSIDPKNVW